MRSARHCGWAIALLMTVVGCGRADPTASPVRRDELRIVLRAEPRTFNPVVAIDAVSSSLVGLMHSALFRVDARTQDVVPHLAERIEGPDAGGRFTVVLRRGVAFPDGEPFGADDVLFSLTVFQDPALGSTQIQGLRVGGAPTRVEVESDHTVRLSLGGPHPDPARLLTGVPMLPRHRLERAYREGRLTSLWSLAEDPHDVIGLGPFRLESYQPGQHVRLVRNDGYWRRDAAGQSLPRLSGVTGLIIGDLDAQVARLLSGGADLLSALDTRAHAMLAPRAEAAQVDLVDLGSSLEYAFLLLNLDDGPGSPGRSADRARWFHRSAFRQALSSAIDREAIARLVYEGRATPLGSHVPPGNARWHAGVPPPPYSVAAARTRLSADGFTWNSQGKLTDARGTPVSFTVLTSTSSPQRQRVATVVQADLSALGIDVQVVGLEFQSLVERVTRTREFDAAIMALGGGDADPIAELGVWQLDGATHLWRLNARTPLAPWESEIDTLMRQQSGALDRDVRKRLYARVQTVVGEELPLIPLVSPHHLVAIRRGLTGIAPGITSRDSLWNVEEWSWADAVER